MNTKRLYQLDKVVEDILRKYEETRDDDFSLILYVYTDLKLLNYYDLIGKLQTAKVKGFPPFESITRCRRKVQKRFPELANKKTVEARYNQTSEYIRYNNN